MNAETEYLRECWEEKEEIHSMTIPPMKQDGWAAKLRERTENKVLK